MKTKPHNKKLPFPLGRKSVLACALAAALAFFPIPNTSRADEVPFDSDGAAWIFNDGAEFHAELGVPTGDVQEKKIDGKSVGVISYNFTQGGQYVGARRVVEINKPGSILSLEVSSNNPMKQIWILITDASDQTFHINVAYSDSPNWQTIKIPLQGDSFTGHWGGNDDGVIVFPVKAIGISIDDFALAPVGELLFRNVQYGNQ